MWQALTESITKDDLFFRVTLALFGTCFLVIGFFAAYQLTVLIEAFGWLLLIGLISFLFLVWGGMLIIGAISHPSSSWSAKAEKFYPDPSGLEELLLVLVIVLFPAVLLTLLLRAMGLCGYDT